MPNFIPKNKKTGVSYPPITEAQKASMEKDPLTDGKYQYMPTDKPVEGAKTPAPVEARKAETAPAEKPKQA